METEVMIVKQALITWQGGMAFKGHTDTNHDVLMDAGPQTGGQDSGPRPGEMLLLGLGGCTGIDVVSILTKMRFRIERFEVAVEAESATADPKYYTEFRLIYRLWGDIPADRFRHAVALSETTYCSVGALYRKSGAKVSARLELNGEVLPEG